MSDNNCLPRNFPDEFFFRGHDNYRGNGNNKIFEKQFLSFDNIFRVKSPTKALTIEWVLKAYQEITVSRSNCYFFLYITFKRF